MKKGKASPFCLKRQDQMVMAPRIYKGRGAQLNVKNKFLKHHYATEHVEALDEERNENTTTEFIKEHPLTIVNQVPSVDIPMNWSLNPYQGCEHGCVYCYARNTHFYWGYSAGIEFENKIIVKENAAELLEKKLSSKNWKPDPIMLSGNTDCYQPAEKKYKITRALLKTFLKFKHPVGIITKNSLILRDLDILQELAKLNLVSVVVSLTTLDETLRQRMEPRTATAAKRLEVIRTLTANGIPVNVMVAPIIPMLNSHEIPEILSAAANAGARNASYSLVRLNGSVGEIFEDWVKKQYKDKAEKVLSQIKETHSGKLNESRFGIRMKGEGTVAASIGRLFRLSKEKYFKGRNAFQLSTEHFRRPDPSGQLQLF